MDKLYTAATSALRTPSWTRTKTKTTTTTLLGSTKPLSFFFSRSIPSALPIPLRRHPSKSKTITYALQNRTTDISSVVGAAGLTLVLVASTAALTGGATCATELPLLASTSSLQINEPQNALSLPTWAIHVSSVVEWITAMVLVWQYGEKSSYESWKGLSWGMVPLLGGAFCACTWHFFYNSESLNISGLGPTLLGCLLQKELQRLGVSLETTLINSISLVPMFLRDENQRNGKFSVKSLYEVLVALQAALTVIGNFTMCIAAFRIYKSSQGSKNL